MGKLIRRIVMLILLAVFLFSGISVAIILLRYKASDQCYEDAFEQFVTENGTSMATGTGNGEEEGSEGEDREAELAPLVVDFEGLKGINGDVVGWIYGEDTLINYPVVQGDDDDFYLHHSYDKEESRSGSIFLEATNNPDFTDANTIIYGHHMKNKSMFATLKYWGEQEYYEEHPILWLLTPQQDYKIILFSGYTTPALSDTYTIFSENSPQFQEYIASCRAKSDFQAKIEPGGEGCFVLLSTCAYDFKDARYVLHGVLEPVDSAGGVLIK